MHISVRYSPDLKQAVRLYLYLDRRQTWMWAVLGVLYIIVILVLYRHTQSEFEVLFIAAGAIIAIGRPLLAPVRVYRDRRTLLMEREVTLTSEGIDWRSETTAFHTTWDKIQRTRESRDHWIFVDDRKTMVTVPKRELMLEQQAELTAFIAARAKFTR